MVLRSIRVCYATAEVLGNAADIELTRPGNGTRGDETAMTDIYAEPRVVTDITQCVFYHTMEVPGYGRIEGPWDLRGGEREYLGKVELAGKRVLEVGTASGYLCFWMEKQGAEVVSYDVCESQDWDVVPYAQYDHEGFAQERRRGTRRLNDGYWLIHRALGSNARVVYGSVYRIPAEIGAVDIVTLGSILLHLRDPFQAMRQAARLSRELVVVTDLLPTEGREKAMYFKPDFRTVEPKETWWHLPPEIIVAFLGILGFEDTAVSFHQQRHSWGVAKLYTVVGRRTRAFEPPDQASTPI